MPAPKAKTMLSPLRQVSVRWVGRLERLLLISGILMLGIYFGARIHGALLSRLAIRRFEHQQRSPQTDDAGGLAGRTPDFSLWSATRIKDYQESLAAPLAPAVAVLRIPKIQLEVPVLEGTDDLILNRGVGRIAGTARPGEHGNIGIAGHRDGFFRGLKDIQAGDPINLATNTGTESYKVDRIVIVGPEDVSVLAPRSQPSITLVTCYPFYYVGSAPQRFVVQASMTAREPIRPYLQEQTRTIATKSDRSEGGK